ncbi:MAG: cytochrome c3 family protein [Planctomycetota bacterium]|nr:cytochrome c3 family protein [Planctomycetota bacterium]
MRLTPIAIFLSAMTAAWLLASCGDDTPTTGEVAARVQAGFHKPDPERIPSRLATNPGTPWGDYLGSKACKSCHEEMYDQWRGSFHSRTLYDAVSETVFGDFSGETRFEDPEFPVVVEPYTYTDPRTERQRFYMRIRWRRPEEGGPTNFEEADTYGAGELPALIQGTYEVKYAFGNRRHQPYVGRWPDGRYWILPIFWNDVEKQWRFNGFRPYVRACAHCHVTGIKTSLEDNGESLMPMTHPDHPRWNPKPADEGWADGAVGCENCHGPGRQHVLAVNEMGEAKYREARKTGEKGPSIWNGLDAKDPAHAMDACGRCHNFFTESACSWTPGPEGYRRDPLFTPLKPSSDPGEKGWQFYDDGSHKSPCTVVEVYRSTKMHAAGIGCAECHDPHGTPNWADLTDSIEDNRLCLRCHAEEFPDEAAQIAHSKHKLGTPGNMCVECHMPRHMAFTNGVHIMSKRIYSHEFSVPTGNRPDNGPPPSCNVCHTDKDYAWTRETIKQLWPKDK